MADDAHMPIKPSEPDAENASGFAEIAREELSVTARAFFAPVVGAVHVVRGILRDRDEAPPKKPKAAA